MEKYMAQCEDGRRRQAHIHGFAREEGDFKIWKAGVRFKGRHVTGQAWFSITTKVWYFFSDPDARHGHLLRDIGETVRRDKCERLRQRLTVLESRYTAERQKVTEYQRRADALAGEIEGLRTQLAKIENGVPLEAARPLNRRGHTRRAE